MAGNAENGSKRHWSRWKIAACAAPVLFMLLNLIAMQFNDEVNWSAFDFVFAGVVLYGALGAYELVARMTGNTSYRAGIGVAISTAVLLIWSVGAVGLTDSDADGLYIVVLAIGVMGAFIARFRPRGMACAMFATALATGLVGVIALVARIVPAHNSAIEILGISGFFVTLFAGSALLFREAAREGHELGAV